MFLRRAKLAVFILVAALVGAGFAQGKSSDKGESDKGESDKSEFDLLREMTPFPKLPIYQGMQVSFFNFVVWVQWGEQWFSSETFGNERFWTDVVGLLNGSVDVPEGENKWRKQPVFPLLLQAIDELDGVRGNLYKGNGGGATSDLVISFPAGSRLNSSIALPEKLHTGLNVEEGSAWPVGFVPSKASSQEANLPYLLDPSQYSEGPFGIGPAPAKEKYRVGVSCALCHYSFDLDHDGKLDIKSANPTQTALNNSYHPNQVWGIGNPDLHLGWLFALAENSTALSALSSDANEQANKGGLKWAESILKNYRTRPEQTEQAVDRGLLLVPRGYIDETPDGMVNPAQIPVLFTHRNWPYSYAGATLNLSDRINHVWTINMDLSLLVAFSSDRAGKHSEGFLSTMTAEQFADILIFNSPAARHDGSKRQTLRDDILGLSDGVPGLLRNDSIILVKGLPGALPQNVLFHKENIKSHRIQMAKDFGQDSRIRGPMLGMSGVRVITPPSTRRGFLVDLIESSFGLDGDEFVTSTVAFMLDEAQPPPNRSKLLEQARRAGLVNKGYEVFKSEGCANCHAGPFTTNSQIVPLRQIGTDTAQAEASVPGKNFFIPKYDPKTGNAIAGGRNEIGYKVLTLRYVWGSAPYLHDGGVGVTLRPDAKAAEDDIQQLLKRPPEDKLYGAAEILNYREEHPQSYLQPNAAMSLQALLLKSERDKVIQANKAPAYLAPGLSKPVAVASMHIKGIGHEFWIDDVPGGDKITALISFLLSLDDEPGR